MWSDLLLDPKKRHDDLRLLAKAMRQRWPIDDTKRQIIFDRLMKIVEAPDDELAIKAITQIRGLESQNQKDEHKNLDDFAKHVLAIATGLGINIGADGNIQATEGPASLVDGRSTPAEETE